MLAQVLFFLGAADMIATSGSGTEDPLVTEAIYAIQGEDARSLRSLLERGLDPNSRQRELHARTLLQFCASFDSVGSCTKLFLERGADRMARDSSGLRAIDYAYTAHSTNICELLRVGSALSTEGLEAVEQAALEVFVRCVTARYHEGKAKLLFAVNDRKASLALVTELRRVFPQHLVRLNPPVEESTGPNSLSPDVIAAATVTESGGGYSLELLFYRREDRKVLQYAAGEVVRQYGYWIFTLHRQFEFD